MHKSPQTVLSNASIHAIALAIPILNTVPTILKFGIITNRFVMCKHLFLSRVFRWVSLVLIPPNTPALMIHSRGMRMCVEQSVQLATTMLSGKGI